MRLSKTSVAVVGAGNIGRHHARNYFTLSDADLHAIVDVDLARAERLASDYGCRSFSTVEEMIRREPQIQAVSVAVPTHLHYQVARSLLLAGKHVLVEKPLAATLAEADALLDLASRTPTILAVGHVERFNPAVSRLKRHLAEGNLGDVLSVVARRVGVFPPESNDANVLLDLAIHDIDVFRFLLNADKPTRMFCNAGRPLGSAHHDFADIFLQFGRVSCLLQVNWLTPVKIRSLAVSGSKGYAELNYVTQRIDFYAAQRPGETGSYADVQRYSEQAPEVLAVEYTEPLARELTGFVRATQGKDGEIVSGYEAMKSLEVVHSLIQLADASV